MPVRHISVALFVCALAASAVLVAAVEPPRRCTSSSDCSEDFECVRVPVDDGNLYCVPKELPARLYPCYDGSPFPSECCDDSDCPSNNSTLTRCLAWPGGPYCGGAAPLPANACYSSPCAHSNECASEDVCVPPAAFHFPVGKCVLAHCHNDRECITGTGGECTPIFDPVISCRELARFECTYDTSQCRKDADCKNGDVCVFAEGDTKCIPPLPPPP